MLALRREEQHLDPNGQPSAQHVQLGRRHHRQPHVRHRRLDQFPDFRRFRLRRQIGSVDERR